MNPKIVPEDGENNISNIDALSPEIEFTIASPESYLKVFPLEGWKSTFPKFSNHAQKHEYRLWQRQNLPYGCILFLLIVIASPNVISRFSWHLFGSKEENYWAVAAKLVLFPIVLILVLHLLAYYYWQKYSRQSKYQLLNSTNKSLIDWCKWLTKQGRLEEFLLFGSLAANTCIFIARVLSGACPGNIGSNIWLSQSCNPVANCHSFPHEAAFMMFLPTMCLHLFGGGLHFHL